MDQLIDAAMARGLHVDACRSHALVGWVVTRDPPEHPGKLVVRLVAEAPSPYVRSQARKFLGPTGKPDWLGREDLYPQVTTPAGVDDDHPFGETGPTA